jgi:hypothetical protein
MRWTVIVLVGLMASVAGCAEHHVRPEAQSRQDAGCEPSSYGSPCCAICHAETGDAGTFPGWMDLPHP